VTGRNSEREEDQCPGCGAELYGPMCPTKPLHDGLGNYYMGRCCPHCDKVLMRIFANREDGRELRDDLKKRAEKDPDPPARSEMPDTFIEA